MSYSPRDTISFLIAELRVARALVSDNVRGTADPKYDLCKGWDDTIHQAQQTLKEMDRNPKP